MRYLKWTAIILFWALVLGFLHYTLPRNDVARITDTYERRIDFGANRWFWTGADGTDTAVNNRDVFFVQTRRADGDVMVYRNEDTGWGWPPYFKFDSANVQAIASDLRSTADDPTWVAVTHYGWRIEFLSVFPNAMSLRVVDGPDVRVIPWKAIVILVILLAVVWAITVRVLRFRRNRIDPMLEDVGDSFESAGDGLSRRRRRFTRWWRGGDG
ncbi:hypothetical protein ROJ8625_01007 [Roseivivax jejudonensis]|uniref:DUF1523 domain-containing protein n=1 Tax=Roseivivax jejudonensis TaxID=1529041 RepID=A0A1X6YL32_9RHOB|nr:DUF1523 family protein [Roseivivax jejudonensis]SLN24512.1 hypothetical protein ROJ8625_01007 [Roseivivax jejudonensis]